MGFLRFPYVLGSILGGTLLLLYAQLLWWHHPLVGLALFCVYVGIMGRWWADILHSVFGFGKRKASTYIIGWFASILLLGLSVGVLIAWYRVTPFLLWTVYGCVALLSGVIRTFVGQKGMGIVWKKEEENGFNAQFFSRRWIYIVAYLFLLAGCVFALATSTKDTILVTPWNALPSWYVVCWFGSLFLLACIIFSHFSIRLTLLFVVLQTLVLHAYVPLTHVLPWGGDVWRHIAMEERIEKGEFIKPVLFGPEREMLSIHGIPVPTVLLSPTKYAYDHMWGTTVLLRQTTGMDIVFLNRWLVPLVWSFVFPVLLFYLGLHLFRSHRAALFFSWMSLIPFSLQVVGSLTLPVSLGLLSFIFVFLLWLLAFEKKQKHQYVIASILSILFLFGYPLYTILLVISIISCIVVRKKKVFGYGLLGIAPFILPSIEYASHTVWFPRTIDGIARMKQVVGEWSGWYFSSALRPHDIASGNILFNHTPLIAAIPNVFLDWRWHVIGVICLVWVFMSIGLYRRVRAQAPSWLVCSILFSLSLGGYMIGWYVLEGDRLLIRRLDPLLALLMMLFATAGMGTVLPFLNTYFTRHVRSIVFVVLFLLAWFGTTTYISGPDMRVVSRDEYEAAQVVWEMEKETAGPYCVLGDTWFLLALESISHGRVVGGGFPITEQFGQTEREYFLEAMTTAPSVDFVEEAKNVTGSGGCWIVLDTYHLQDEKRVTLDRILGEKEQKIGSIVLWRAGLPTRKN